MELVTTTSVSILVFFFFSSLMYCIISNRRSAGGLVSVPAILRKIGQRSVSCMAEECVLAYRRNILRLSFLFEDHLLAFEANIEWLFTNDWRYIFAFVHFNGMLIFVQRMFHL
jgi:hypothetical protein